MAPTAVVVVAVSYCAWPYVFPSADGGGKPAAAMPEISPAQLSPVILPPPARDPFRPVGESLARPAQRKKAVPAGMAGGGSGPGGSASHAASAASAAGGKPADPLGGLALGGTSILADRRLAVINGRIYAEREPLSSKDPSAPPCVVARIERDRVLLECAGRTATLRYANVAQPKMNKAGGVAEPLRGGPPPRSQSPVSSRHRDR
jgi:hypothetical protein